MLTMRRFPHRVVPLVVVIYTVVGLAAYWSILGTFFVSDDFSLIGRACRGNFFPGGAAFLRPLVIFSFVLDHWLWNFNPLGYHFTTVGLHIAAASVLFVLVRRLFDFAGQPQAILVPFLAGLLFLVQPSHVESVTWIAGRSDSLAAVFGLAATLGFLGLIDHFQWKVFVVFLALFALSLFSKESVLILPFIWAILLALAYRCGKQPGRNTFVALSASVLLLCIYFVVRRLTVGHLIGGYGTSYHLDVLNSRAFLNAAKCLLRVFVPGLPPSVYQWLASPTGEASIVLLALAGGWALFRARSRFHGAHRWLIVGLVSMFLDQPRSRPGNRNIPGRYARRAHHLFAESRLHWRPWQRPCRWSFRTDVPLSASSSVWSHSIWPRFGTSISAGSSRRG